MIILHSTYVVKAEKKADAHQLMVHMANIALRTEECLRYEFFNSLDQSDKVLLVQEWRSLEAIEKYYQSNPVCQLLKELPQALSHQVETRSFLSQNASSNAEEAFSAYRSHPAYLNNNHTLH